MRGSLSAAALQWEAPLLPLEAFFFCFFVLFCFMKSASVALDFATVGQWRPLKDNPELMVIFEKSQNWLIHDHYSVLLTTAAEQLLSYMTLGSARYKVLEESTRSS